MSPLSASLWSLRTQPVDAARIAVDGIEQGTTYYLTTLVRRGPAIAASVTVLGDHIEAEISGIGVVWTGKRAALADEIDAAIIAGEFYKHPFVRVAFFGEQTTETEYRYKRDFRLWAIEHEPTHPEANPYRPIDLNALPVPEF